MLRLGDLLFAPLVQLHAQMLQEAVQRLQNEGLGVSGRADETEEIECALLAFKTLRYLMLYGFTDPSARAEPKVRLTLIPLTLCCHC